MALRNLDPEDPTPARGRRSVDGPLTRAAALWRQRRILGLLVRRDLKVRYADSILGYVWSILDPLAMGMVYWFVFATIFGGRNVGEEPYILYLMAGMLPFRWYQTTVTSAAGAIKGERLVRSAALPREIWILRLVFSKGAEYLFSLPVLAAFIIAYRKGINWEIIYMIPAALIQIVLSTGLALLLSALGALFRDVDRVMHIVMRFMFYATPIIYGLNDVLQNPKMPEFLKDAYVINPMTGIVSLYRAGLFPAELHLETVVSSVIGSVIALVVGWWVFIRLEPAVLKEI
jgi:ABC-2 type transport system permease protein